MKSIDKYITHNDPRVFADPAQGCPMITGNANGAKFSISETKYTISHSSFAFIFIINILYIIQFY